MPTGTDNGGGDGSSNPSSGDNGYSPSLKDNNMRVTSEAEGMAGYEPKRPRKTSSSDIIISNAISDAKNRGASGTYIFFRTFVHYQIGLNNDLIIDASSLDFSGISQKNLIYNTENDNYGLDLYKIDPFTQEAIALGKLTLNKVEENKFEIQYDLYDFNIETQNGFTKRNIATFFAGLLHDNPISFMLGGEFKIKFKGSVYIKPKPCQ
jgi:hypothetical protein